MLVKEGLKAGKYRVGTEEYNQTLSEGRAFAVRDFLIAEGVPSSTITASGSGKYGRLHRTIRTPEGN